MAKNFQGKIPRKARAIAEEIAIETKWQKYVVYDSLMALAVLFPDISFEAYDEHAQDYDTHKTSAIDMDAPAARLFGRKRKVKKAAEFFREAMYHGACLIDAYLRGQPLVGLTGDDIFAAYSAHFQGRPVYANGLKLLQELAETP